MRTMNAFREQTPCIRQQGVTLVELMIGIAIGLVITAAMGYLYSNSRQTYRVHENIARMQENGRYALDTISREVRMAGYWGCAGQTIAQPVNTINGVTDYLYKFDVPVEGHEATGTNTWAPALDAGITNVVSGTDVLTLRGTFGQGITVTAHPGGSPPGSADLKVTTGSGLSIGDIVLVSDCVNAAVFQITNFNSTGGGQNVEHDPDIGTPGNSTKNLGKEYTGGEIMRISTKVFYIRQNPAGRPALYVMDNGLAEELVENVENMQITYGVDTDNNREVNSYVAADAVANWNQVRAVRVRLLLVSPDNGVSANNQVYRFRDINGDGAIDAETAADRRLRFVYATTIGIRNRLQ